MVCPTNTIGEVCRFLDSLPARLCELAGPDALVIVMSDPPLTPGSDPDIPAPGLLSSGIFVMVGPGIRADEWLLPVSSLDVVPMTLAVFQLPADEVGGSNHLHIAEPPSVAAGVAVQEVQLEREGYVDPRAEVRDPTSGAHEYALGLYEFLGGRTGAVRTWLMACTSLLREPAFPHVLLA